MKKINISIFGFILAVIGIVIANISMLLWYMGVVLVIVGFCIYFGTIKESIKQLRGIQNGKEKTY